MGCARGSQGLLGGVDRSPGWVQLLLRATGSHPKEPAGEVSRRAPNVTALMPPVEASDTKRPAKGISALLPAGERVGGGSQPGESSLTLPCS